MPLVADAAATGRPAQPTQIAHRYSRNWSSVCSPSICLGFRFISGSEKTAWPNALGTSQGWCPGAAEGRGKRAAPSPPASPAAGPRRTASGLGRRAAARPESSTTGSVGPARRATALFPSACSSNVTERKRSRLDHRPEQRGWVRGPRAGGLGYPCHARGGATWDSMPTYALVAGNRIDDMATSRVPA